MGMRILKRGFVLLGVFVLIIMLSSLAQAKTLHGAWHYSGDSFSVGDDVFLVTHYNFYDVSVILRVNNASYVLREGECKLTPTEEYCITEIFRDLEESDEDDPIKFEGGVAYAGLYVQINTRGPDLDITRDFSTSAPELNEEVVVSVTVENEGSENAGAFVYTDTLPEGVSITSSSSGTERTYRSVTYTTKSISIGEKKSFTYKFKVTDYMEFTSKPNVTYIFEGVENNVPVTGKSIKVVKPYSLTATLSPSSVEASEQTALSIKVENTVSDDITVDELRITIPSFISLQSKPGELTKKNENYYWNDTIEKDKYKLINLLLTPRKSGTFVISVSLKVTDFEGKNFSESKNITLTSKITALESILSVIDKSVSEGSTFRVAFSIKNPNKRVGFRDINVGVKSDIFSEMKAELDELLPGKTQTLIINDTLRAPYLDKTKSYNIEAYGTYETTTSEYFNFSKKVTLTVTPVSEVITIIQSTDKSKMDAGKNITVTVKIRNNNEEPIQVYVSDRYPERLAFLGGKTSSTVFFDTTGTKQAYTYSLQAPLDYDKESFLITTTARIEEKEYFDNKSMNITVVLPEPEPEQGTTPTETPTETEQPEKKTGFFERVIDAVTGFFKRLLKIEDK